jgi:hypothetical protein
MKKLIITGSVLVAIMAANLLTNGSFTNAKAHVLSASNSINTDTVPKKDTMKKKKDTMSFALNTSAADTTPKKKKDTALFAYNTANIDTTPKKKKDTTLLAYTVANNDTTPKKKDSLFLAMR